MPRRSCALGLLLARGGLIGNAGCAEETAPTRVACVGDSITSGDGASGPSRTYPAVLQAMLGSTAVVQNFGHSGATALGPGVGDLPYSSQPEYDAATTFVTQAGAAARVAVVVLLGANDSKAPLWDAAGRQERFRLDYAALVDHFSGLATRPTVYLATPLGVGDEPCCGIRGEVLAREIAPIVQSLAAERHLPILDLSKVVAGHPELLTDGVHPNDRGYETLAATIRDALVRRPPTPPAASSWRRHFPFLR